MAPFYGWGSTVSRLQSPFEEVVYFLPLLPRNSWYSLYRPRKDARLSRPRSHPVVLNTGPMDWKSSILITRPQVSVTLAYLSPVSYEAFLHKKKLGKDFSILFQFQSLPVPVWSPSSSPKNRIQRDLVPSCITFPYEFYPGLPPYP